MTDLPTVGEVLDKLAALGSPRQIASHFEQAGVRGRRGRAHTCPLAQYLAVETGHQVAVTWSTATYCDRDGAIETRLPGPVSEFAGNFDQGFYPRLIESAS